MKDVIEKIVDEKLTNHINENNSWVKPYLIESLSTMMKDSENIEDEVKEFVDYMVFRVKLMTNLTEDEFKEILTDKIKTFLRNIETKKYVKKIDELFLVKDIVMLKPEYLRHLINEGCVPLTKMEGFKTITMEKLEILSSFENFNDLINLNRSLLEANEDEEVRNYIENI